MLPSAHSHTLSLSLSLSLLVSCCLALSHTRTHNRACAHAQQIMAGNGVCSGGLSRCCWHRTHTYSLFLARALSLARSLSHTHTHTTALARAHAHTQQILAENGVCSGRLCGRSLSKEPCESHWYVCIHITNHVYICNYMYVCVSLSSAKSATRYTSKLRREMVKKRTHIQSKSPVNVVGMYVFITDYTCMYVFITHYMYICIFVCPYRRYIHIQIYI